MPHPSKVEKVERFAQDVDGKSLIVVDYSGMKVVDGDEIRSKLKEVGGSFVVFKNTLLRKVFERAKMDISADTLRGMTAIAACDEEQFNTSGSVLCKAEKAKQVVIRGGYYQGQEVDSELVRKMGNLPSKEVLLQMFVGGLMGVVSNLVFALQGIADLKKASPAPTNEASDSPEPNDSTDSGASIESAAEPEGVQDEGEQA